MGLLELAQEKKTKSTGTVDKSQPVQEITFDDPHGLLAKAQLLRETKENRKKEETSQNIDIIKEDTGLGWNKIGKRRIIYNKDISEYRYEIIEPELTEFESEKKKELAHLFKMLADIDAFNMEMEEKESFLKQTLDQIIVDNNISFIPEKKGKGVFSKLKLKKREENDDTTEEEPELDQEMTPEQIEESKNKILYYLLIFHVLLIYT